MNNAVRSIIAVCVFTCLVSAQPNQTSKNKQPCAQPKESVTVVVEKQEIPAEQAESKPQTEPPHWYTSLKGPEWWLFIAAVFTLGAVIYQAKETAQATQAMRDGVVMQSESLRPRLTIGGAESPFSDMVAGKKVIIDVKFLNTGGTPAYEVQAETWLEFLAIPFPSFTPKAVHHAGGKVTVHPQQPSLFRIPFNRSLTKDEIADLKSVQATLYLRVRLTYGAFGKPKYSDYTFQITPTTLNIETNDSN